MDSQNSHDDQENGKIPQDSDGIAILIDGNNFYKNLEFLDFSNVSDFRFGDFVKFLAEDRKIIFAKYYKGVLIREQNNPKSEKMYSDQQRLFANLENQGIEVERGQMMKYLKYKKCRGFYSIDQKIKNKFELKKISEQILSNYKTCHNPIILLTPDSSIFNQFGKEKLEELPGIYVLSNEWKEKGVDVKIAVDILTLTKKADCRTIVLLSSDSDLMPAVKKAQEMGRSIEYVGFGEGCYHSTSLLNQCDKGRLLIRSDVVDFFT